MDQVIHFTKGAVGVASKGAKKVEQSRRDDAQVGSASRVQTRGSEKYSHNSDTINGKRRNDVDINKGPEKHIKRNDEPQVVAVNLNKGSEETLKRKNTTEPDDAINKRIKTNQDNIKKLEKDKIKNSDAQIEKKKERVRGNSVSGDFRGTQERRSAGINVKIPLHQDEVLCTRAESNVNKRIQEDGSVTGNAKVFLSVNNPNRTIEFSENSRAQRNKGGKEIHQARENKGNNLPKELESAFDANGQGVKSFTVSGNLIRDTLTHAKPEHQRDKIKSQEIDTVIRNSLQSHEGGLKNLEAFAQLGNNTINVDTKTHNQIGVRPEILRQSMNHVKKGYGIGGRRSSQPY